MTIRISNRTDRPIYEQIYMQIKQEILAGRLAPEEALPSIRSLAKDLRVSVITTKRAYEELEKGGYIDTVPGKGSYVARRNLGFLREGCLTQIEDRLRQIIPLAKDCGLTAEDVTETLRLLWEEEGD